MHARSLLAATLFALTSFVAASPPGCLLGAVNTYSEPADIKSVCSEKDVTNTIAKFCGDSSKQALEAFADICNGAGVKVATDMPKSSGSASATASGSKASASMSGSVLATPSGNATVPSMTGSPSKSTGSGAAAVASGTSTGHVAESTGAAGKLEIGVAAALFGLFAVAF